MKKLKFILISFFLLLIILIGLSMSYFYHRPLFKLILSTGRFLYPPINAVTYINGKLRYDVKIFKMNQIYDIGRPEIHGKHINALILWVPNKNDVGNRSIIFIDLDNSKIGNVNSSTNDYNMYFNLFLFQSDNGQYVIPWDSPKSCGGDGFDPKFQKNINKISFSTPNDLCKVQDRFIIVMK